MDEKQWGNGVQRVAVATDRSVGGDRALRWAVNMARTQGASLVAIQVVVADPTDSIDPLDLADLTDSIDPSDPAGPDRSGTDAAEQRLLATLGELGYPGDVLVVAAPLESVADAIVAAAHDAGADVLVVGNSGMQGRREFLLSNVANRVTHIARCTVVIANSEAGGASADSGLGSADDLAPGLRDRAAQISQALGPPLLAQLAGRVVGARSPDGQPSPPDGPRKLREALEQLGPTFGKLGQILSTRPDLLSQDYLDELASLQSDVPPMPEDQVVSVMEAELGVPWEDVFASIEAAPLAAGTIGQVHRATLADGHRVVLKVQRPEAAVLIDQDLQLLQRVVSPLGRSRRANRIIDLPSVVDQLGTALRAELDFREEARNLRRMDEIVSRFPNLAVPGCHLDLSTSRLLVMDEVDGVPVLEAPASPERSAAARQLLHSYYQQVLEDGFFHADPHPGNLMWSQGCIWLLDLGMVGRLDTETRHHLTLLLLAFARGDVSLLSDLTLALSDADLTQLDLAGYQADMGRLVDKLQGRSLQELMLVDLLNDLTELAVRHGVPLPSSLILVGKALGQVQLTVAEVDPDLDPIEEAGRYLMGSVTRRLLHHLEPQDVMYEVEKMRFRLNQIGEGLATISGGRPGRHLEVGINSAHLEQTVTRAGRTVALGLSAGLSWVAVTVAASSGRVDPRTQRALQVLATGLSAGLVAGLARRS